MPIPPPPPPPPGPPPPPTFGQANTEPPKLSREEQRGRGALLQDICKGTKLKKVTQINDRSAPILEKPKGSGGGSYGSSSAAIQPKGGLFQGGVPKLRPVGAKDSSDSSSKQTLQVPSSRAAAPRPPVPASNSRPQDDADNSRASPPELPRTQRPSLPDLSRPNTTGSTGMKHSSSASKPQVPSSRAAAPRPPVPASNSRPQDDADNSRASPPELPRTQRPSLPDLSRPNTTGSTGMKHSSSAPPPPPYRQPPGVPNGPSSPINESAPELPQRHNSLHRKTPGPLRGLAPPPPASASPSLQSSRPPPPARDPPSRGAATRGAPPLPPIPRSRLGLGPHVQLQPRSRARGLGADAEPSAAGCWTRAGSVPDSSGPEQSEGLARSWDDFESKYSFHPVEDFPAPEEYKYFQRIYPSKTNRGDDNLCNVPRALPCSPAKRSKENRGRRLLFGDPQASPEKPSSPGPSPRHGGQETPRSSGLGGQPARTRLFRQEGPCYQQAKRVLHAAVPDRLHAREREMGIIRQFLREHVGERRPGSLYVSGAPGTGKTACLSRILLDCKDELAGSKTIVLNCMSLSSPQGVFPAVAQQLGLPAAAGREGVRRLEKQLTAQGPMVLLVLDELDQLESKGQDVLYTLFEWPRLPGSRLVLV
ncbi:PREDICTED: LOW QUALITY PROTEIN: WAS/WASL-interacting protein family member 2, partial [Nipponia nippon]|uniref:LOW QUALITY PROTEIN: WAS/WASL-interacting protein family member 2 n=1 Tax=Nipponia nippon TaxID=128390 RepID=UPI000511B3C6